MPQILRLFEKYQLSLGKAMQRCRTFSPGRQTVYAIKYILGALTSKAYNHGDMIARVGKLPRGSGNGESRRRNGSYGDYVHMILGQVFPDKAQPFNLI